MYNVLIVDDDTLMRDTLRAMISRFKNFQIIGEAASGGCLYLPPLSCTSDFYGYYHARNYGDRSQ